HQFRSTAYRALYPDIATVSSHHLNKKYPVVGCGSVPDFVNRLQRSIQCCVKSNGIVCAKNIIINCSRTAHYGNAKLFTENLSARKGAVTTNSYQAFDPVFLELLVSLLPAFLSFEIFASR